VAGLNTNLRSRLPFVLRYRRANSPVHASIPQHERDTLSTFVNANWYKKIVSVLGTPAILLLLSLSIFRLSGPDPASRGVIVLAEKSENESQVTFRAGPDPQKAYEEEQKVQREREERAWRMLDRMVIDPGSGKRDSTRNGSKSNSTPQ
jgi:hypothetical protein